MTFRPSLARSLAAASLVLGLSAVAVAAPVTITAQLTGDPRPGNPDSLFIDVTISFDDTSNQADWVVDINSPLHPNAKLDEFYFNVVGAGGDYTFGNFVPVGWSISTPATSAGGGNIAFLFEALDPAGPPNAADVTNSQNLTFSMFKTVGTFSATDFLNGASTCSNDQTLGCGQLGAHLQSLVAGAGESDSGFLLGNYNRDTPPPPPPPQEIPEPGTLALVGLALLAGAGIRRRRG